MKRNKKYLLIILIFSIIFSISGGIINAASNQDEQNISTQEIQLVDKIANLKEEYKTLMKEIEILESKLSENEASDIDNSKIASLKYRALEISLEIETYELLITAESLKNSSTEEIEKNVKTSDSSINLYFILIILPLFAMFCLCLLHLYKKRKLFKEHN